MARIQCECGRICRSRKSFKAHVVQFKDGTRHVQASVIQRFKNVGPNKVDQRKLKDMKMLEAERDFQRKKMRGTNW